jgi:hypothetical protein
MPLQNCPYRIPYKDKIHARKFGDLGGDGIVGGDADERDLSFGDLEPLNSDRTGKSRNRRGFLSRGRKRTG